MAATPRRDEHREQTRQAVLDAACLRFCERGYAGVSIDEIARTARVSKGAVYYHFADKAALFEALYRDRQQTLHDAVRRAAARRSNAWDRLDAAIGTYVEHVALDPEQVSLLAQAPTALGSDRCRELDAELWIPLLMSSLQAPGRLRRAPGEILARALLGALREAAMTAGTSTDVARARRDAAAVVAALAAGLRARGPRAAGSARPQPD